VAERIELAQAYAAGMQGWADQVGSSTRWGVAMQAAEEMPGFASGVAKRGIKRPTAKDESAGARSLANRGTSHCSRLLEGAPLSRTR
jgi:hypothetical protein